MNFYGLVKTIDIESGMYGRIEAKAKVAKQRSKIISSVKHSALDWIGAIISSTVISNTVFGLPFLTIDLVSAVKKIWSIDSHIVKLYDKDQIQFEGLWIPDLALNNNYNVKNEDHLFGLFENSYQFKAIMKSQGNSNFFILERDHLPENLKHYGGPNGKFNYGLYCEHPKDMNVLLPLSNYNELIKTMVLEEMMSVFVALGAKSITIEEETKINTDVTLNVRNVDGKAGVSYTKETLRSKNFGKGYYNPDGALNDTYFVHDYPSVMNVVNSRKNGNQTKEEFLENINLDIGLKIDIVKLFHNEANFKYNRRWHFTVEFYDKNEL
jgi:hypothetical protein